MALNLLMRAAKWRRITELHQFLSGSHFGEAACLRGAWGPKWTPAVWERAPFTVPRTRDNTLAPVFRCFLEASNSFCMRANFKARSSPSV